MHCPTCGKSCHWVWRLSPLNLVLGVLTCGLWLLVAPLFRLHCSCCGITLSKTERKVMLMGSIVTPTDT